MPHQKHARTVAELDFHEDRVLFPGEAPQDIIGFCVGLTGKPGDPLSKRFLNITARRIGINPEYTDIRREVGNLLLRLWRDKKTTMDRFWIKEPRSHFDARAHSRHKRVVAAQPRQASLKKKEENISVQELTKDDDGILFYRIAEAFNPKLFERITGGEKPVVAEPVADPSMPYVFAQRTRPISKQGLYVNGVFTHEFPLLDIVRPTLLIYTMDASFLKFTDDCVRPKNPSNRLSPYNRNLRLWFNRRVLGWYSEFDADTHKDGGEYWYDLVTRLAPPNSFNNMALRSFGGDDIYLADPGDGMGGGERFP